MIKSESEKTICEVRRAADVDMFSLGPALWHVALISLN